MTNAPFDFRAYLAAKKTVDDRALNRQVLQCLQDHLPQSSPETPLRVLDVAAGIGTMLERLIEWQVLGSVEYTAVDLQSGCIAEAAQRLPTWAEKNGFQVSVEATHVFSFTRPNQQIKLILQTADIFDFVQQQHPTKWDLLIAHAFLDLVDVPTLLPDLLALLKPAGLYYFTINFDGETIFLPPVNPPLDDQIVTRYHAAMDEDHVANLHEGGTRTGRHLIQHLLAAGTRLIRAGSSDWVVYPQDGKYPAQEAFFLHCIIKAIEHRLQSRTTPDLPPWLEARHTQIERGELIYIAHQLDFFGRRQP
ncbi:MAG: class I SAM-dependent methyltransferase [Chloroflexota bacterium]